MKTKKITIISVFVLLLFTLSTSGQVFAQEQEPTCYQFGDAGSVWIPIENGKFQFKWNGSTYPNTYPTHCSYGVNMRVIGYLR